MVEDITNLEKGAVAFNRWFKASKLKCVDQMEKEMWIYGYAEALRKPHRTHKSDCPHSTIKRSKDGFGGFYYTCEECEDTTRTRMKWDEKS